MRRLAPFLLLVIALAAGAQDLAREERLESEVLASLMVGEAVQIPLSSGRPFLGLYTEGKPGKPAIVLVHGRGVHPDHGIIGSLRAALSDKGYTVLSIQMPVLGSEARAEDYIPALLPGAAQRIAAAAQWLGARGHTRPILASHSFGAWMSQHYFESVKGSAFAAWVCMGCGGKPPALAVPVLDVHGEKDYPAVLESAAARRAAIEHIPGSRQHVVAGADHFYAGKESELARLVADFIDTFPPSRPKA
jgi:alpha/beta superfamily hydrolase